MKKVLIVVDMQNDFITGSLGTKEAQAIVPNVKKKIEKYKAKGDEIIFTRDTHKSNYLETFEGKNLPIAHCIEGTWGWIVADELSYPEYRHVNKSTFGYMGWGHFVDELYEIYEGVQKEIEIVGLCTDICVISNALLIRAEFPNTKITVDASCCAGVSPEKHKSALEVMKSCQINVIGE